MWNLIKRLFERYFRKYAKTDGFREHKSTDRQSIESEKYEVMLIHSGDTPFLNDEIWQNCKFMEQNHSYSNQSVNIFLDQNRQQIHEDYIDGDYRKLFCYEPNLITYKKYEIIQPLVLFNELEYKNVEIDFIDGEYREVYEVVSDLNDKVFAQPARSDVVFEMRRLPGSNTYEISLFGTSEIVHSHYWIPNNKQNIFFAITDDFSKIRLNIEKLVWILLFYNKNIDLLKNRILAMVLQLEEQDIQFDRSSMNEEEVFEILVQKVHKGRLIGKDLLNVLNEKLEHYIYKRAINALKVNCAKYVVTNNNVFEKETLLISLVIIAYKKYDSSFWPNVRQIYQEVYEEYPITQIQEIWNLVLGKETIQFTRSNERRINHLLRITVVPLEYIGDFIKDIYRIYRFQFHYKIPDNVNTQLYEIYIKRILDSKGVDDKTREWIVTTKRLFYNEKWFAELIVYSKFILYELHKKYWNLFNSNDEDQSFIQKYISEIESKRKKRTRKSKEKRVKANFIMNNSRIFLEIPAFRFMPALYTDNIHIDIYNGNEKVKEINSLRIKKSGDLYEIQSLETEILDPLGKIRYEIYTDSLLLFSSQKALYREILMFDEEDQELVKTLNYDGEVVIVGKKLSDDSEIDIFEDTQFYQMGMKSIHRFDKNDILVSGEKYTSLKIRNSNRSFPVYKRIERIRFENDLTKYMDIILNGSLVEKISASDIIEGLNKIIAFDKSTKNKINEKYIIYEPELTYKIFSNNNKLKIKISSLILKDEEYDGHLENENIFEIPFYYHDSREKFYFNIQPSEPYYKIDAENWRPFSEPISIRQITVYSKIWFIGISPTSATLETSGFGFKENVLLKRRVKGIYIEGIRLLSRKNYDSLYLFLFEDNIKKNFLEICYRTKINFSPITYQYDSLNNCLNFEFSYKGSDELTVRLKDNDTVVYQILCQSSPFHGEFQNVMPKNSYNIEIGRGGNSIFSEVEFEILKNIPVQINTVKGFEFKGYQFQTLNCVFYQGKNQMNYQVKPQNLFLLPYKWIQKDEYIGYIVSIENRVFKKEVRVMIQKEVNNKIEIEILDKDGDQLIINPNTQELIFNDKVQFGLPIESCMIYRTVEAENLKNKYFLFEGKKRFRLNKAERK